MLNALTANIEKIDLVDPSKGLGVLLTFLAVYALIDWGKWIWKMQKEGMRTGRRIKY